MSGDQGASRKMIEIASGRTYDIGERCEAISMLAQRHSKESLTKVIELLGAKEQPIRRTAYFSLPQELRISGYDYHVEPTLQSQRAIDAEISHLTAN